MQCAKEMNIKPVTDMLAQFGMNEMDDEQMEEMNEQINSMMEQFGGFNFLNGGDDDDEYDDDDYDDEDEDEDSDEYFEQGGARSLPFELMDASFLEGNEGELSGDFDPASIFSFSEHENEQETEKKRRRNSKKKDKNRKYLNQYCTNLTARAVAGELDRIIGRDREIERVIQILSRRSKNNPCLIGEPGVGKTAIAEGLALRISAGEVPLRLQNKEIHLLDLTGLVAGTQFRGQFESRIKGLLDEIKTEGNIILFIDEVHTLVGTGDSEGSMSAANIMKPPLSRGEIQVIGATTFKEYRKHIEKDSALERRFQPVIVEEPSIADTIKVLLGVREYYESYHKVSISEELIRRVVNLSERYITDRFLPDKAIDLLDESCACALLRNKAISQYEALGARLAKCNEELTRMEEKSESTLEFYEKQAKNKMLAENLKKEISELEDEVAEAAVKEEDLAKVIELWTGIPASKVTENENRRLSLLDKVLKKRIVGQDEAVDMVAAAIMRSRVQISPRRHPASFIFVGPTGVGKTELVKALAEELFHSPETLIRLDMSEFMEKHSVSKIIGSPPGYVGYDEAGQLTEKVRRKPYSVLLFDEIEKAHPDVLNILLQILDEGRVTDAQGRVVNFENTVIIMTSNAGSDKKGGMMGFARSENELNKEKASKALSEFLRPEFLARVDEIVVFNPLSFEDFKRIAVLTLEAYAKTLDERAIALRYSDDAVTWLAEHSQGGKSAARDLLNLIRRRVEDKMASLLVEQGESIAAFCIAVEGGDLNITIG
jgi:ATP-dependent Clp protease ATP-binding subunit ClpA